MKIVGNSLNNIDLKMDQFDQDLYCSVLKLKPKGARREYMGMALKEYTEINEHNLNGPVSNYWDRSLKSWDRSQSNKFVQMVNVQEFDLKIIECFVSILCSCSYVCILGSFKKHHFFTWILDQPPTHSMTLQDTPKQIWDISMNC